MDSNQAHHPLVSVHSTPQTPKHPRGIATMSTSNIFQEKRPEKANHPMFKMNPHSVNVNSDTPKS